MSEAPIRHAADRPSAGILILNWNGEDLLREHLPSVVEAAAHTGIPVAVADNGSSDGSLGLLAREFPGVLAIPLHGNHGFGGGYNRAIAQVPWDVVILLNNDMLVAGDFADHLLAPFARDADLFGVSAQILLQDPLQRREETGRTSGRLLHGELQLAHLPVGSGDALVPVLWSGGGSAAVSRRKFAALGGFEELYGPFYMEDVDLSFRAWQRGWPSVLAPESRVWHRHRGSTARLDQDYVETIIARNRTLFVALNVREKRRLARHVARLLTPRILRLDGSRPHYRASLAALRLLPEIRKRRRAAALEDIASDAEVLGRFEGDWRVTLPAEPDGAASPLPPDQPSAGGRRLKVLFLVPMCVYPISHGGASRIVNTIWGLSRRGHEVRVLSLVTTEDEREAMASLPGVAGSQSFVLPLERSSWPGGMEPAVVANTYRRSAAGLLEDAVARYRPDVLVLEYTQSGSYISPSLRVPTILVEHDLAYRSSLRGALNRDGVFRKARALFDTARLYRWEIEATRRADLVLTASELEADVLRSRGVSNVSSAVPNGVDVAAFEPPGGRPETRDILFVGYFLHPPNVDGLDFFTTAVWPHLAAGGRELSVSVVGSGLPADLTARVGDAGFRYAGYVEDLARELWSHRVFVCPIRFGAGTRIKLLEAAAARCAIVSTTLGAEGLGLVDGRDVLLADDPAAFARAVERLLGDDQLRRRLGDAAHDAVQRQFDWPALAGRLEDVCYELTGDR
jgi:GT2 family glycosyltransferase